MTKTHIITQSAMLLAIALVIQSLRIIVPLPPIATMLIIGTGVNLVLLVLAYRVSMTSAVVIGTILPIVAFMQGQLPQLIFCPAVAIANIIFVCLAKRWRERPAVWLAPAAKAGVLLGLSNLIAEGIGLPPAVRHTILLMMGVGQMITAMIALIIEKKLEKNIFYRKSC